MDLALAPTRRDDSAGVAAAGVAAGVEWVGVVGRVSRRWRMFGYMVSVLSDGQRRVCLKDRGGRARPLRRQMWCRRT